jgi:hypothetical protein
LRQISKSPLSIFTIISKLLGGFCTECYDGYYEFEIEQGYKVDSLTKLKTALLNEVYKNEKENRTATM